MCSVCTGMVVWVEKGIQMKRLTFSFSVLTLVFIWIYHTAATDYNPAINSVIGDISYVKKFGHLPATGTDENLRIKTHLAYAEMLLRSNEYLSLDPETRLKRETLLGHLHDYWVAGIFPRNYDRKNERSPCFIDKEGNICAVGYLVEKSAGRQMAENINKEFKYSKIADMNSALLAEWIADNGLTKEEAAIIQPSYDWQPAPQEAPEKTNRISASYGISSGILGTLNLSAAGFQFFNPSHKLIAKVGLVTGAVQAGLGVASLQRHRHTSSQPDAKDSRRTLSAANIGLGVGTMLLSSWNLIVQKPKREKQFSWNLYGVPLNEHDSAVAFSIKRKF